MITVGFLRHSRHNDAVPDGERDRAELHRWFSSGMIIAVVALIPWTAYLAVSLPSHFRAHDWAQAWVGFNMALIATLAYTAWAAWFRRQILAPASIVAATMLLCDAWFDVNTSFGTKDQILTMATALFANLPLAIFLIMVARRIMLRSARILTSLKSDDPLPKHAHDVKMPFATTWRDPAQGTTSSSDPGRTKPDA